MPHLASIGWAAYGAAAAFLAACHLNHPRHYFQDLLCSASLYWIPLIVLGTILSVRRCFRARRCSAPMALVLMVQGYLIFRVGELAAPYLYFPKAREQREAQGSPLSVLFSHTDFAPDGLPQLAKEAAARRPDLVVLFGEQPQLSVALEALGPFSSVVRTPEELPDGILVLSRLTVESSRNEMGVDSLPALSMRMRAPGGEPILLGALSLVPPSSQDAFFRNKVTSRRIATLMRYSEEPRLAIGSFQSAPFSPLVSMYVRQVRLWSVMFDRGLFRTFDVSDPLVRLTLDHAFVSRDLQVTSLEMLEGISRRRRGMAFGLVMRARQPAA